MSACTPKKSTKGEVSLISETAPFLVVLINLELAKLGQKNPIQTENLWGAEKLLALQCDSFLKFDFFLLTLTWCSQWNFFEMEIF